MTMKPFISLGILIALFSCTSPEKLLNDKSTDRIYFGKTGGFTNIPMEYVLFEKGQLFKIRNDSLIKIHRISGKLIRTVDSLLTTPEFDTLSLDEPGNITYYIRTQQNGTEKEVKWSESSDNEMVKELYKVLLESIQTNQ